jgi:PKD repeat protein/glucose/arabinose dehydrogenase
VANNVDRLYVGHELFTARFIAVSLIALGAALFSPPLAGAAALPEGFEEIDLVTGLNRPVKVVWTPDGRKLIAEKDGVLKVAAPGASTATTVLDFRAQVNHAADRGFLGLAVDVDYAVNNYVYLLYTHELQPLIPDQESAAADAKLDRIKLSPTNSVTERITILGTESSPNACPPPNNTIDCIPSDDTSHSIGTVISAPDGTLFVGAGDGAKFSGVDERALRSLDERSLAGKVLHISRDGRGLPGHAFCPTVSDLTQNCTKIHAKGFRNPFRFTRRADGAITLGDVGWGSWEEINLIPSAGRDYGWPCYEGQFQNSPYSSFGPCQAYANGTAPPPSPPAIAFQHAEGMDNAVMAGPTYGTGPYPAAYHNKLFSGDYGRRLMRVISFNAQGVGTATQFATDWLGVDLASAPGSGNIVYVYPGASFGDGEGEIREIRYSPDNRQPVALASAAPTFGAAPLTVNFNGAASSDPDGDPLSYRWNFGDGSPASTQQNPSHTYGPGGPYNARLTVSDGRGGTNTSAPIRIDVDNAPPVPSIQAPATYRGGQSVVVHGSATDPEDGSIPAANLAWRVLLVHGTHNHPRSVPNGSQIGFVADPQHDADSHYELALTATDSDGRTATTGARINPQTAQVQLRSVPSGAPVSYGDITYTTPKDLISTVGFEPTVVVPPELVLSGGIFGFQGWSDGGERLHTISIPATGLTLTAQYGLLAGQGGQGPGGGGGPGGGSSADRKAPKLTFSSTRARDLKRGIVRGVASDPGGAVKAVAVGLARRAGSKCRWWSTRLDRPAAKARGCRSPAWMKASLKRTGTDRYSWRLALGKRVAPGRYLLRVRALDAAGNATVSSRGVTLRAKR